MSWATSDTKPHLGKAANRQFLESRKGHSHLCPTQQWMCLKMLSADLFKRSGPGCLYLNPGSAIHRETQLSLWQVVTKLTPTSDAEGVPGMLWAGKVTREATTKTFPGDVQPWPGDDRWWERPPVPPYPWHCLKPWHAACLPLQ